jgi:hypothetical protein
VAKLNAALKKHRLGVGIGMNFFRMDQNFSAFLAHKLTIDFGWESVFDIPFP